MRSTHPELALERILIALERDVIDAADEELLAAARELGMDPTMKGSAAFFGVTHLPRLQSWPRETGKPKNASAARRRTESEGKPTVARATRERLYSWLAALTPQEAKALRARFGIDKVRPTPDEEEVVLRALARNLAVWQKKQ
jgi:hypothetical protein